MSDKRVIHALDWRSLIAVHPAADLFRMMTDDELVELGEDIAAHGLRKPITTYRDKAGVEQVLDGRNRIAAMQRVGLRFYDNNKLILATEAIEHHAEFDPFAYVISANLHRRHLTAEDRRKVIAGLLKADPTRSNSAIAKLAKVSDKTAGAVRDKLVATSEIPRLAKTVGADGKARPARKVTKEGQVRAPRDRGSLTTSSSPVSRSGQAFHATGGPTSAGPSLAVVLHGRVPETLENLVRWLNDERRVIAGLPLRKRVIISRGYLSALGVTLADLLPVATDPKPVQPVAMDPDPVRSTSPLVDASLMAAYLATPPPYQAKVKDWTMRGDRLGEPAPTAADGSTLPFEALWRNAGTDAQKEFRRDLLVLENAGGAA
jgi:ParB-like chromosome segregation protein Spo0J